MKVKVNEDACIGCGACVAIADDIFQINDEGLSTATSEKLDDSQADKAREAIESCPTGAIEEK